MFQDGLWEQEQTSARIKVRVGRTMKVYRRKSSRGPLLNRAASIQFDRLLDPNKLARVQVIEFKIASWRSPAGLK